MAALPWVGPGAAFKFLRELDQEKLDAALKLGLNFNDPIEARAEGDNKVVANVSFAFIQQSSTSPHGLTQSKLRSFS